MKKYVFSAIKRVSLDAEQAILQVCIASGAFMTAGLTYCISPGTIGVPCSGSVRGAQNTAVIGGSLFGSPS